MVDINALPESPEELKKLIMALQEKNTSLSSHNETLQHRVALLERHIFGRKSEKWIPEDKTQMRLFDEAEAVISEQKDDETEDPQPPRKKKSGEKGRKPIPEDIPREEVIHKLPEEERKCSCCGELRPIIGYEESEELSYIPAVIKAIVHKKEKCGPCKATQECRDGNDSPILTATAPKRIMPGSIASPSLLAFIITGKYCDSLPFYRHERIFKRLGVDISRSNMCNWSINAASKCSDLIDLMKEKTREGPLINMDETTVQVLKEQGREPGSKSQMWVTAGSDSGHKIILFNYSRTRNAQIPEILLEGFLGALQTDGYAGYNSIAKKNKLWHVACLAHIRRKFFEAAKETKSGGQANKALKIIKALYRIEKELRSQEMSDDDFVSIRREKAIPVLKKFRVWLDEKSKSVLPSSPLGKAVSYALSEYVKLVRYLKYAYLTPDNNVAENAIRPFVIGRKNWMFNDTPRGAYASATLYSLVETAKANGVEPMHYLKYIFEQIPLVEGNKNSLEKLLPWNIPKEILSPE